MKGFALPTDHIYVFCMLSQNKQRLFHCTKCVGFSIILSMLFALSHLYRVIQAESAILWEMIVCVILSKNGRVNMGPILNGYRDNGKTKIRTILRARTAIT
jgi:amino acid permease